MTLGESIFILSTLVVLLILAIRVKDVPWKRLGFLPDSVWKGFSFALIFSAIVFILVQLLGSYMSLPSWVLDKDPILNLLIIVLLQEVIFRALLINWLEPWGKHKAIWLSTIIFASTHLFLPDPLFITSLSLIGGYFWGWHFLKFRNIYWIVLSHLLVNLSFNFLFFQ